MTPDSTAPHNRPEAIDILVIDDDAEMRDAIDCVLEAAGYRVVTAANGREGLREFAAARFDLVIVDIFMPEQDGFEVLMEIGKTTPRPKVLVISGGGTYGLRRVLSWAERFGVQHTLSKPFTREQLLTAIERILSAP